MWEGYLGLAPGQSDSGESQPQKRVTGAKYESLRNSDQQKVAA